MEKGPALKFGASSKQARPGKVIKTLVESIGDSILFSSKNNTALIFLPTTGWAKISYALLTVHDKSYTRPVLMIYELIWLLNLSDLLNLNLLNLSNQLHNILLLLYVILLTPVS